MGLLTRSYSKLYGRAHTPNRNQERPQYRSMSGNLPLICTIHKEPVDECCPIPTKTWLLKAKWL